MGVYLVVQTEVVAGYEPFASFLVTIPIKDGQNWNYDVDASPKMELIPKKDIVPPPDTETPDTEVPDTEVPDTEVPDTEVPNTEDTEDRNQSLHRVTEKDTEEYDWNFSKNGSPDDAPKIPQTGQLVWPIPVLAFIGLVLILVGKRWKDEKK